MEGDKADRICDLEFPKYTSQTCSRCRTVDSRSQQAQSKFYCTGGRFAWNTDGTAAINMSVLGLAAGTAAVEQESRACLLGIPWKESKACGHLGKRWNYSELSTGRQILMN